MHPYGKEKVKWDLMVAVMIVYSTLSVPFRIGFEETAGLFGTVVDTMVDIGFMLDIVLSFRTAFVDEVTKSNDDVFAVLNTTSSQRRTSRLHSCVVKMLENMYRSPVSTK